MPVPRVAGGSLIFLVNLKGGGLLVGDSPPWSACYVSAEGCFAFIPLRRVQWIFFSFSDLRTSTRFAECESNKLPTSENIFRKFIYGRRARGGTVRIVYRRHNAAMYSYAARTGKRRTYSWADLGPRCCLLVYSCIWLDVLLDAYGVSLSAALSWHAMQMYARMQTYIRITQFSHCWNGLLCYHKICWHVVTLSTICTLQFVYLSPPPLRCISRFTITMRLLIWKLLSWIAIRNILRDGACPFSHPDRTVRFKRWFSLRLRETSGHPSVSQGSVKSAATIPRQPL